MSEAPASRAGLPDGELLIKAAGKQITGWLDVNLTRGCLHMPGDFRIGATAKYAGQVRDAVPINSSLQILIGGHVVHTGYLERITERISAEGHEVELVGRGRCCDLIDCSAILQGMSLTGASIGTLAKQLVKPFAGPIGVELPDGDGDKKNYIFNINLGESPYEILERVGRWEGLMVYEDADGDLVLSRVGTASHSSGFTEGQNVQSLTRNDTRDERFSSYIPQLMSADTMGQVGAGGNAAGSPVPDPAITRYRPRIVISEQMVAGQFLAQQRATWEMLHRAGESFRVELVCDSWLDSSGTPWTPNMLAPLSMPSVGLSIPDLVITTVSYRRDGRSGTTAHITLMPKEALTIEPSALQAISARFANPTPNSPTGQPSTATPAATAPNAGGFHAGDGPGPF